MYGGGGVCVYIFFVLGYFVICYCLMIFIFVLFLDFFVIRCKELWFIGMGLLKEKEVVFCSRF